MEDKVQVQIFIEGECGDAIHDEISAVGYTESGKNDLAT